jgi:hypothetical protein
MDQWMDRFSSNQGNSCVSGYEGNITGSGYYTIKLMLQRSTSELAPGSSFSYSFQDDLVTNWNVSVKKYSPEQNEASASNQFAIKKADQA